MLVKGVGEIGRIQDFSLQTAPTPKGQPLKLKEIWVHHWEYKTLTYITTKSSCGKLQEAYCLWHNLFKHNLSQRGYPIPAIGGTPSCPIWGYPILGYQLGLRYPCLGLGYPPPPSQDWDTPQKGLGATYWGTPQKGHEISGSIMGWRWGTPLPSGGGQSQNITSCRTMYAGSNKLSVFQTIGTFLEISEDISGCGRSENAPLSDP